MTSAHKARVKSLGVTCTFTMLVINVSCLCQLQSDSNYLILFYFFYMYHSCYIYSTDRGFNACKSRAVAVDLPRLLLSRRGCGENEDPSLLLLVVLGGGDADAT